MHLRQFKSLGCLSLAASCAAYLSGRRRRVQEAVSQRRAVHTNSPIVHGERESRLMCTRARKAVGQLCVPSVLGGEPSKKEKKIVAKT